MQWFKSSSKMKRWIFLILVGIVLTCYGLAKVFVMKEISINEIIEVVAIFVAGFMAIVVGLVFLNKRTLELLIESSDERMENKDNVNLKSLIFNKTVYDKGPNIVAIGGGTGLDTVLRGLKNYTNNLTAIVTVSDYGESTTNSRRELKTLPLNDIKDSIVALSSNEDETKKLFNYKFSEGRLMGLDFSDIYFSAMKDINGNFVDSVIKSNEVVKMIGKVIPVTLEEIKISAELANGYIVEEKSKIPEVVSERLTKINRIMISPSNCKPAPGVIEAIKNADCIVIGPGSLYTNVIPNLLVNGVAKAIKESTAIKVYISNIMTEPGQTDDYSITDHINAIIDHCGTGIIDYCIYDTGEVVPEYIKKYNMEGQDLVEQDINNFNKIKGIKFLQRDLSVIEKGYIRHDSNLVATSIIGLICDDLKFQDKQNDPQYLMLNNKLKEEKKINKNKQKMKKRALKNRTDKSSTKSKKSKSKFSNKYKDRLESIKEADKKAEMKMKQRKAKNTPKKLKDDVRPRRNSRTSRTINTDRRKNRVPKTVRTERKKTRQEIREEMLKQLQNSKLK